MHPNTAAIYGLKPHPLPHWEHWSCPDAETFITGIDYYEHPRLCRLKINEMYPQLDLALPATDEPRRRPKLNHVNATATDELGRHMIRWGDDVSIWHDQFKVKTPEEVFAFSPLEQGDFRDFQVVEAKDYRDEEQLYQLYRKNYPPDWGQRPPADSKTFNTVGFYNTMFMWPLNTFGYELFMETCLDERFGRIMDEFAEINRRVFRVFARLPVDVVVCHDDIVTSRGPVCSPAWMRKYIFPRYEEYWAMIHAAGKKVVFMVDGCIDRYADDVFACGADGIITEPHTDFKTIARKHPDKWLSGDGDNRIVMRNRPEEIQAMVQSMAEVARQAGGYSIGLGNHVPWNLPPQGVKFYLDCCLRAFK
ncbi:MAG: hypothetical protein HQ546_03725 [Planctomycetes bacterium]|nr:hypothetical protein [Planctomycetota bacterium]